MRWLSQLNHVASFQRKRFAASPVGILNTRLQITFACAVGALL